MRWSDVTDEHDGLLVDVWAPSTPSHPTTGESYTGRVYCPLADSVAHLVECRIDHTSGAEDRRVRHIFAEWWNVRLHAGAVASDETDPRQETSCPTSSLGLSPSTSSSSPSQPSEPSSSSGDGAWDCLCGLGFMSEGALQRHVDGHAYSRQVGA